MYGFKKKYKILETIVTAGHIYSVLICTLFSSYFR